MSDFSDSDTGCVPVAVLSELGRPPFSFLQLCSKNSITSHHSACSTVRFTYSKDWCFSLMCCLMASASAWTEALAWGRKFAYWKTATESCSVWGKELNNLEACLPAQHQLDILWSSPEGSIMEKLQGFHGFPNTGSGSDLGLPCFACILHPSLFDMLGSFSFVPANLATLKVARTC